VKRARWEIVGARQNRLGKQGLKDEDIHSAHLKIILISIFILFDNIFLEHVSVFFFKYIFYFLNLALK
jgi:hypothetical protein